MLVLEILRLFLTSRAFLEIKNPRHPEEAGGLGETSSVLTAQKFAW